MSDVHAKNFYFRYLQWNRYALNDYTGWALGTTNHIQVAHSDETNALRNGMLASNIQDRPVVRPKPNLSILLGPWSK